MSPPEPSTADRPQYGSSVWPPKRRSLPFPFAAVTGYLYGLLGLYTNFFSTFLSVTATVIDVLVLVLLAWLAVPDRLRGSAWRRPLLGRSQRLLIISLAVTLAASATLVAHRPPGKSPVSSGEECLYRVPSDGGVPIPIIGGGSITGHLSLSNVRVNAVSFIIGLDARLADKAKPHPMRLQFDSEKVHLTIDVDDIENNAFTRFNLPTPIDIPNRLTAVTLQLFNNSPEPVGIYVKVPEEGDLVPGSDRGIIIVGQDRQRRSHKNLDQVLSGCIAGRQR